MVESHIVAFVLYREKILNTQRAASVGPFAKWQTVNE
jgi:hypothetical protein